MAHPLPPLCDETQIKADTEAARAEFREKRLDEPLADYNKQYPTSEAAAEAVISALDAILKSPADRNVMSSLVGNKASYSALRSLAATPISADDLETLARAKINKTALRNNQDLANDLAELLRSCLDPKRFPWVYDARPATPGELEQAKLATSVLTAVSAVQAARRGDERKALEGAVQKILEANGYTKVKKTRNGIQSHRDYPPTGSFMTNCKFGANNADFVIHLMDGRLLAIECKASNSEVNGFKRLNKEVMVDAVDWVRAFGKNTVVPAAALRGVFKPENVSATQAQGVYLFWWHRIEAFSEFLANVAAAA